MTVPNLIAIETDMSETVSLRRLILASLFLSVSRSQVCRIVKPEVSAQNQGRSYEFSYPPYPVSLVHLAGKNGGTPCFLYSERRLREYGERVREYGAGTNVLV